MILHVVEARYERDYILRLKFNDGAEGHVDLADALYGTMFAPLKDFAQFKAFRVDPELETVVWDNGADFAPEFLYSRLLVNSQTNDQNAIQNEIQPGKLCRGIGQDRKLGNAG